MYSYGAVTEQRRSASTSKASGQLMGKETTRCDGFPLSNAGEQLELELGYGLRDRATHNVFRTATYPCGAAARLDT
eukprot:SAG31_NODE_22463_length_525_cov_0.610329_1_plen_75_part_10